MNSMLEAFRVKPFDLEPVLSEWSNGPVFKGNSKKDPPVTEWLEQIKAACIERNIPEEYWYKVGQHFMGKKAKARFEEVKKVISTVNGGKYRWTWKKFKVAMTNMGWEIDANATETVKVRGSGVGMWFSRKKSDDKSSTTDAASTSASTSTATSSTNPPVRTRPKRSNTLRWTSKPLVEEPAEEIETESVAAARVRPKPTRSRTLAVHDTSSSSLSSSFWSRKDTKDDTSIVISKSDKEEKQLPARPSHQKAKSETAVATRRRSDTTTEVSRSRTTDEHNSGEVAKAPVWLLNAVNALDFLTTEHPKAVSVLSAILITVGSIPAIPAISAGAGGAILASGAAHAIGAVAVGLGQALGASAAKNQQQNNSGSSSH